MLTGAACERQRSRSNRGQFSGTTPAAPRKLARPGRDLSHRDRPPAAAGDQPAGCGVQSGRWGPRGCFLAGASRAEDVGSSLPMDSLTVHGAPLGTSRGPGRVREDTARTGDPGAGPPWADADRARAGSAGTMTRAAVIAPWACTHTPREHRAEGEGAGPRPVPEDSRSARREYRDGALGTAAPRRAAAGGGTGRIGLSSSSASRWRCTVCTPSGTAGDGTKVRGHRCAGIETQPKRAPLTGQRTRARIGTAARRRSGGPSPGCWTSILADDSAEMVARW
jgi:hypothetical protein